MDILFIGNSVDDENVGIRTSDEPILSKCPIGEDDVWTEEVKPSLGVFSTTTLSESNEMLEILELTRKKKMKEVAGNTPPRTKSYRRYMHFIESFAEAPKS